MRSPALPNSPQARYELYQLIGNLVLAAELERYTSDVLERMLAALNKSKRDIARRFEAGAASMGEWTAERLERLFYELDAMSLAARLQLSGDITEVAGIAGEYCALRHAGILSVGGLVSRFTPVALTAGQYRAFFLETPLEGHHLADWVNRAFAQSMRRAILTDIQAGVLQGEGYPSLVRRMRQGFDLFRDEAVTLTRTYVQTANITAAHLTAKANEGIFRGWRWCATLEQGFTQSGNGTCLCCAALDGQEFAMDEGPIIPLHVRCRCCRIYLTKTWRELGVDIDEMDEAMRPYVIQEDQSIGAGARQTITESGFHQGNYGSWLMRQGEKVKLNVLGPGRLELLQSGKITFDDLVDGKGRLRTLKELGNG